ncbi:MAG TPA: hypothetical protein VMV10_09600 [Pirellulales bacterium]|nr:hypothetical protein [Pirellulales bacterium]
MAKKSTRGAGRRKHGAKCLCCGKRHEDGAPWWNQGKSCWSITTGKGRSQLLVKARDVYDREAHDLAMQRWKDRKDGSQQPSRAPADGENLTVTELCDHYLDHLESNAKLTTYEDCLALFKDLCGEIGELTVADLRHGGVKRIKQWAKGHAGWGNSTLGIVYSRVKSVFNFAANSDDNEEAMDLIASSPIRKLNTGKNRMRAKARESFFTPEQEAAILTIAEASKRCPQFAIAFKMLIATGCRPEEFCTVTADDVHTDEQGNLYWFVEHKNKKHTGIRRRVYMLTAEAEQITRQQVELYPTGALFRNGWNLPWTRTNLLNQLRRITKLPECQALGLNEHVVTNPNAIQEVKRKNSLIKSEVKRLPVPKERREYKYVVYTTRHTFGYRWANGVYGRELSYQRIADLMGNSAKEVERTYGHASQGTPGLVKALKSAATDTGEA